MKLNLDEALKQAIASYNEGKFQESETCYKIAIKLKPDLADAHYNLAVTLKRLCKLDEAEACYKKTIHLKPEFIDAYYNLALIQNTLGKLNEAEASFKKVIELNPKHTSAYNNLGILLNGLSRLEEAEACYKKVIELNPYHFESYFNLGVVLEGLTRLKEAEACYKKVIKLKPELAKAHYNLGLILTELASFEEAEISFNNAIKLKLDYFEAYNAMGVVLKELNRFEEAVVSLNKAIELKPSYECAYNNLGTVLQEFGKLKEAEASYKKALELKPDDMMFQNNLYLLHRDMIFLKHLLEKKSKYKNKKNFTNRVLIKLFGSKKRLSPNPFITNRKVEAELINNLYEIDSKGLDKMKGIFFGNGGRHSENFQLFDNDSLAIKAVAEGLINIMKQAVKSEIYVVDSFFNIVDAGGGISPHRHIRNFDKIHGLINQKYSLTYYLSVGDHEPGIFKLHNPDEEFLPFEGMVMIFPATRMHSAVYAGKTGRIMIGVNFYSVI